MLRVEQRRGIEGFKGFVGSLLARVEAERLLQLSSPGELRFWLGLGSHCGHGKY